MMIVVVVVVVVRIMKSSRVASAAARRAYRRARRCGGRCRRTTLTSMNASSLSSAEPPFSSDAHAVAVSEVATRRPLFAAAAGALAVPSPAPCAVVAVSESTAAWPSFDAAMVSMLPVAGLLVLFLRIIPNAFSLPSESSRDHRKRVTAVPVGGALTTVVPPRPPNSHGAWS